MTATPFRADARPLQGEVIYKYPFARAMVNGFIKNIQSRSIAPDELYFTYPGDTRKHTLEEVLVLREEQWFRRGVALSPECNRHIVEASIQRCNAMRAENGIQHQIIAAACSIDHARQIRTLYEQCGYRAAEIHSDMDPDERDTVLERLRRGQLDCIIQVQMLGEGFDHPRLSVAAIFRPFRSLAPYIQFVGRVMRVIIQDAPDNPDNPDNRGYIVSHVGLNNEERWEEFRELDLEDQALLQEWLRGQGGNGDAGEGEGGPRPRRFDTAELVNNEIIGQFIDREFLDPEDDRVLDELLAKPVVPGLTVGDLVSREQLRQRRDAAPAEVPTPIPVSPQRRRQAARDRLADRTGPVVNRVLTDLRLGRPGRDVARAGLGAGGGSNVEAVTILLNREIRDFNGGKDREDLTVEEAEAAFENLDQLADTVRDRISAALGRTS